MSPTAEAPGEVPEPVFAEPVFAEPWQAQAFALAVELSRRGFFTWREWTDALAREIAGDRGADYYQHWLRALEELVEHKRLLDRPERLSRIDAWDRAERATPHGEPIVLGRDSPEPPPEPPPRAARLA